MSVMKQCSKCSSRSRRSLLSSLKGTALRGVGGFAPFGSDFGVETEVGDPLSELGVLGDLSNTQSTLWRLQPLWMKVSFASKVFRGNYFLRKLGVLRRTVIVWLVSGCA